MSSFECSACGETISEARRAQHEELWCEAIVVSDDHSTVVDNYNEIYGMKIKQSFKYARQYAGVSFGIGVVIYVLMMIPILGAVLAPLLGAVTATITMHELNKTDRLLDAALV